METFKNLISFRGKFQLHVGAKVGFVLSDDDSKWFISPCLCELLQDTEVSNESLKAL